MAEVMTTHKEAAMWKSEASVFLAELNDAKSEASSEAQEAQQDEVCIYCAKPRTDEPVRCPACRGRHRAHKRNSTTCVFGRCNCLGGEQAGIDEEAVYIDQGRLVNFPDQTQDTSPHKAADVTPPISPIANVVNQEIEGVEEHRCIFVQQ